MKQDIYTMVKKKSPKKKITDTLQTAVIEAKKESRVRTAKEMRLMQSLMKTAEQCIQGKGYTPLTLQEFILRLRIPDQHADIFKDALDELVKQNNAIIKDGRYCCYLKAKNTLTGTLSLHPRGFGFVKVNEAKMDDVFIPKPFTMNGVDGDTVEVLINCDVISNKGPEGKIVSIISRGRRHLAGIITEVRPQEVYYAFSPLLGFSQKIRVKSTKEELKRGDRIVMEVAEWGGKDGLTLANFSKHLGSISDPSCDITAALEEFELRQKFPAIALKEAKAFGDRVPLQEIKNREDLRHLPCITIDPDTAKDFDDAVNLSKDKKGHYHLGVHIADVSFYVKPGSALDDEAAMRCNSTYFPGFCLPMLPHELSSNLCSLKPNVNRLTVSILMEFNKNGDMIDYRMTKSVIKSVKRFTYKEAKAVLDGKKESPHAKTLDLMVEMCALLKKKRYERGSVEFGLPELVVLVDDKGVPTGTDYIVYDITHQLIEEFMLKANEVVATHIAKEGKALTYRIHDKPSEDNLKDFSLLAMAFGFTLSPTPTPKEIQKLFDEAMHTPYGEYLATSYIRKMRLAIYSSDNIGHYGLNLTHYCHFTSPIRRYVDLVAHRILFNETEDKETLEKLAQECSAKERISAKAENSVVLLKKLRMLDANKRQEPFRAYEGIVTRVKNFGIYFEVIEYMLEGYLHVSELDNDYFNYDEVTMSLKGAYNGYSYKAGDKLTVLLKTVDLITLETKWDLVPSSPPEEEMEESSRQDHRKKRDHKKSKRKHDRKEAKDRNKVKGKFKQEVQSKPQSKLNREENPPTRGKRTPAPLSAKDVFQEMQTKKSRKKTGF